jgi:hypothetical protein
MLCIKEAQFMFAPQHKQEEFSLISCITLNNSAIRYTIVHRSVPEESTGVVLLLLRIGQRVDDCRQYVDNLIGISETTMYMDVWILEYPVTVPDDGMYNETEAVRCDLSHVGPSAAGHALSVLVDMEVRPRYSASVAVNIVMIDAPEVAASIYSRTICTITTIGTGAEAVPDAVAYAEGQRSGSNDSGISTGTSSISNLFQIPNLLSLWAGRMWTFYWKHFLMPLLQPLLAVASPTDAAVGGPASTGGGAVESSFPHAYLAFADGSVTVALESCNESGGSVSTGHSCPHSSPASFTYAAAGAAESPALLASVAGVLYAILAFCGRRSATPMTSPSGLHVAELAPGPACGPGCLGVYRCVGDLTGNEGRYSTVWVGVQSRSPPGGCALVPLFVPAAATAGAVFTTALRCVPTARENSGLAVQTATDPSSASGLCGSCAGPPATARRTRLKLKANPSH